MTENLNFAIAFLAGIISFISPCILPVIPSYLSFIGGITYNELIDKKISRWGIFIKTLFFISGFSVIFIVLGFVFSGVITSFGGASRIINMIAGTIVIVLGLNYIFDFFKILNIEKKFHFKKRPRGAVGSMLLGMAFGAGWTPCIGPILASILFLAGTSGQGLQGTVLLAFYSAGLGIPFILAGLFFSSYQNRMEKLKQHFHKIKIGSGVFLLIIGVLIFFGSLSRINTFFFKIAGNLEAWRGDNPSCPRLLFFIIFLIISITLIFFYIKRALRIIRSSGSTLKSFIFPARLILIVFFIGTTILSFSGILDIPKIIILWMTFQGI